MIFKARISNQAKHRVIKKIEKIVDFCKKNKKFLPETQKKKKNLNLGIKQKFFDNELIVIIS